jgi:hypothetical protein
MGMAVDYAMPGLEVIPGTRAMDRLFYGSGAPTHLVDQAGDAIRRLRNSPQISVEYVR